MCTFSSRNRWAYKHIYACTYPIHQNIQNPTGSLIDDVARGSLSGSDVVVLCEAFLTPDVTGTAGNT